MLYHNTFGCSPSPLKAVIEADEAAGKADSSINSFLYLPLLLRRVSTDPMPANFNWFLLTRL